MQDFTDYELGKTVETDGLYPLFQVEQPYCRRMLKEMPQLRLSFWALDAQCL